MMTVLHLEVYPGLHVQSVIVPLELKRCQKSKPNWIYKLYDIIDIIIDITTRMAIVYIARVVPSFFSGYNDMQSMRSMIR
jgi:hypothetical protein